MKRGDIKRYREFLNAEGSITGTLWANGRGRGQRTRQYGDYLYSQDREKFMVDMEEWLRHENTSNEVGIA